MNLIDAIVAESTQPRYVDPLLIRESCLILPDVEVPYHNAAFINRCIEHATRQGVKSVLYAGDWFHIGALAHFFESEKNLDEELDAVEKAIGGFIRPFDKVYYIAGNHDRRPQITFDRFVQSKKIARLFVPPELALEFAAKVSASDYFYCWAGEGEHRWRIVHPKSTNTVPANAAKAIAVANNCNVAMAHDHLIGLQQTPDARHWAFEIGCCVDIERLAYLVRDTTRPKMRNGAMILHRHGAEFVPELLVEGLTQWGNGEPVKQSAWQTSLSRNRRRSAKTRTRKR